MSPKAPWARPVPAAASGTSAGGTDEQIWSATEKPPQDTRAKARSSVMQYLGEYHLPCIVDWHQIYFTNDNPFELKDPFCTYDNEVEKLLKRLERIRSSEGLQGSQ